MLDGGEVVVLGVEVGGDEEEGGGDKGGTAEASGSLLVVISFSLSFSISLM